MKLHIPRLAAVALITLFFYSCSETEDPGPLQESDVRFNVQDFDRIEIGDAMHVTVEHGNFFEIEVRGDRRNLDDLDVFKRGTTLIVKFDDNRGRRHDTYVTITMPQVRGVNFSGATQSTITGFYDLDVLDVLLSGASSAQLDVDASALDVELSGASVLTLRGSGDDLTAEASGASVLRAFDYPVAHASINVSGASTAKVNVETSLTATASGASAVAYRGNPAVDARVFDASTIRHE